jgi:hypothetical protein
MDAGDGNTPDHDRRREQIRAQCYKALCERVDFDSVRDEFRNGKGLPRSLQTRLEDIIAMARPGRG